MNEYNEGDLVEAVKGDEVIRGRIEGKYPHIGTTGLTVSFYRDRGFTVSVIEKAAPKLPTEPGVYVSQVIPPSPTIVHKITDGRWVDADDTRYVDESYVESLMPLTRLEEVPVTAKKVLDAVRKFAWADGFMSQLETVERQFGVSNV